jgi:chromosome segregation ATPase
MSSVLSYESPYLAGEQSSQQDNECGVSTRTSEHFSHFFTSRLKSMNQKSNSPEEIEDEAQEESFGAALVDCEGDENDNNMEDASSPGMSSTSSNLDTSLHEESHSREKLSELLEELSRERENIRLAASAGKALLEQLVTSQEERNNLVEQLNEKVTALEYTKGENTRLKNMCQLMESELQQYDLAWSKLEQQKNIVPGELPNACQKRHQMQSLECTRCTRHEEELKKILREREIMQRRCIEMEIEVEKQKLRVSDLSTSNNRHDEALRLLQIDYTKSIADIEYMTSQMKFLREEHCSLINIRDNLRERNKQLKTENLKLQQRVQENERQIKLLVSEKRASTTQRQVYENRAAILEEENRILSLTVSRARISEYKDSKLTEELLYLKEHVKDLQAHYDDAIREKELILQGSSSESPGVLWIAAGEDDFTPEGLNDDSTDENAKEFGFGVPICIGISLVVSVAAARYLFRR